jgi:hypothetical protein
VLLDFLHSLHFLCENGDVREVTKSILKNRFSLANVALVHSCIDFRAIGLYLLSAFPAKAIGASQADGVVAVFASG